MKYLFAVLASLAVAAALPTDFDVHRNISAARVNSPVGFASVSGGTYGGSGGASWTVWDPWAFQDAIQGNSPRAVYVQGRIDLTQMFVASPGVVINMGSFKHILGANANAEIFGGGIRLSQQRQIIIRNLKFTNALNYAPGEQPNGNGGIISMVPGAFSVIDNIDIDASVHVWVDHCEFSDDPWNAKNTPESMRRHDGQVDIKQAANFITISNNIFRNHNLVALVGHNDANGAMDNGFLKVTYVGNWFMGTVQRNPRVRFGEVHILNNLYTDISDYGIGIGVGAKVYAERNVFVNVFRSWGLMSASQNPAGHLLNDNNWLLSGSTIDSNVPNSIGWNPSNYYNYSPLTSSSTVESSVRNNAGMWS